MPTLVAFLEVPAILVALLIARTRLHKGGSLQEALRELVTGKSILLLVGGLVIGLLGGEAGLHKVAPLYVDLFNGALTIFLLEMGMVAAGRFRLSPHCRPLSGRVGILMPIAGALAVWLGALVGLSLGGSFVLGVLAASASYIAAPAAVRISSPQANPGYYLTAALAVTFPFNLAIGLPIYYAIAQWLH